MNNDNNTIFISRRKNMEDIKNYVSNKKPCGDLVELVLNFVIEHKLTKNNVWEVFDNVTDFMDNNAVIEQDKVKIL